MTDTIAFNDLPVDLPHAGRVAERLRRVLDNRAEVSPFGAGYDVAQDLAAELSELLLIVRLENEAPADDAESNRLRESAAMLGRRLAAEIEAQRIGDDRIGQCVRNLFECLGLGQEGAIVSLCAGENPASLQRPVLPK